MPGDPVVRAAQPLDPRPETPQCLVSSHLPQLPFLGPFTQGS